MAASSNRIGSNRATNSARCEDRAFEDDGERNIWFEPLDRPEQERTDEDDRRDIKEKLGWLSWAAQCPRRVSQPALLGLVIPNRQQHADWILGEEKPGDVQVEISTFSFCFRRPCITSSSSERAIGKASSFRKSKTFSRRPIRRRVSAATGRSWWCPSTPLRLKCRRGFDARTAASSSATRMTVAVINLRRARRKLSTWPRPTRNGAAIRARWCA